MPNCNQHVVDGWVGDIQGNLGGEAPIKLRLFRAMKPTTSLLQAPSPFKEVATIAISPFIRAIALWR
jgi:hypothetical protein